MGRGWFEHPLAAHRGPLPPGYGVPDCAAGVPTPAFTCQGLAAPDAFALGDSTYVSYELMDRSHGASAEALRLELPCPGEEVADHAQESAVAGSTRVVG